MKPILKSNTRFNVTNFLNKSIKPKSTISSFYLYAGDVEIEMAKYGHRIICHTNKRFVYDFWRGVIEDSRFLAETIESIFPKLDNQQLDFIRHHWHNDKKLLNKNCLFYILNMCSENGYMSNGTIDVSRLNKLHISRLKTFKLNNFFPFLDDGKEMIDCLQRAKDTDYILMPIGPYSLNLFEYGKNKGPEMYTFNHREIHTKVKDLNKKCILLYKNHSALFNLYKSFNIKMVDKYGRVVDKREVCEDLIITNF